MGSTRCRQSGRRPKGFAAPRQSPQPVGSPQSKWPPEHLASQTTTRDGSGKAWAKALRLPRGGGTAAAVATCRQSASPRRHRKWASRAARLRWRAPCNIANKRKTICPRAVRKFIACMAHEAARGSARALRRVVSFGCDVVFVSPRFRASLDARSSCVALGFR